MIYRVGSIGLQGHTNYTFKPMETLPNTVLAAVSNASEGEIRRLRDGKVVTEQTKFYDDFHEMLEKEALDIVSVYTDHGIRAESIIAAAKSGASVYTEKPLAMNLPELEQVKQAVQENKTHLTMMLNLRFDGKFKKLHDIVQAGTIGEVTQATAQKSYKVGSRPQWMQNPKTFAGIIPFIACHALDLIRWSTALEFMKGSAFQSNVARPDLENFENTASMIVLAENGATFSTRLDFCRPELAKTWGDDRLRVAGVEGVVEVIHEQVTLITQKQQYHIVEPEKSSVQFVNFIEAIEGREENLIPFDECHRITEICLKLREAAKSQTVVEL